MKGSYITYPLKPKKRLALVLFYIVLITVIPQLFARLLFDMKMLSLTNVNFSFYLFGATIIFIIGKDLFLKEKLEINLNLIWATIKLYLLIYLVNVVIGSLLAYITNTSTSANQSSVNVMFAENKLILYFITTCILAPFVEEMIFRGVIFRSIRLKNSFLLSALISGFLFGFSHIYNSLLNGNLNDAWYLIIYGISGIIYSYAYEYTKSIKGCILMHAFNNFMAIVFTIIL